LPSHPKLKLICLGEGEEQAELRTASESLGLAHCVRLVGFQPNVPVWLAAADINVLPTFYEGLPLTILEAMASGLPTVASNVGGIPEVIEDGVSGLLVPAGDIQRLAKAVASLVRDPATRVRIGHAARARVLRSFSFQQQIRCTEKMYLELCGAVSAHEIGQTNSHMLASSEEGSFPLTPASYAENNLSTTGLRIHEAYNTTNNS
jgi:glycosyltransferase involved in cell wall biosynthesis